MDVITARAVQRPKLSWFELYSIAMPITQTALKGQQSVA